jgi:hypothetical protein
MPWSASGDGVLGTGATNAVHGVNFTNTGSGVLGENTNATSSAQGHGVKERQRRLRLRACLVRTQAPETA